MIDNIDQSIAFDNPHLGDNDYNSDLPKDEFSSLIKPHEDSKALTNHLFYIDHVIEQFKFCKYHLATLFVCIFSMFLGGYSTSHYIFNKSLLMQSFSWTNMHFSIIFVFQNLFCAIGAFSSVTSTTLEWDIYSNSLLALSSLSMLIILHFFNEASAFVFISFYFNFCQGFINNICCNFLLEEFNLKYKELAFLFVSSFRLMGCCFFGVVAFVVFDLYNISDPITTICGLTCFQLALSLALMFFYESPRLLFCNNQLGLLYEYIEVAVSAKAFLFKKRIMRHLAKSKEQFDREFGDQGYVGVFSHFIELWKGRHLKLSLKAMVFVFLATFLMSNIKDCYSFFIPDSNKAKNLFIIAEKSRPHDKIIFYYLVIFFFVLALIGLKHLLNISRRILSISSLVLCFISVVLLFIFTEHFIYFLGLFEAFASFYFMLTYMYFSTYTTTKLRNSMTSLMFLTMSASLIFQCVLLVSIENYSIFFYINLIIIFVLVILDFVLIPDDTKDLKLQQIEAIILSRGNPYRYAGGYDEDNGRYSGDDNHRAN